MKRTHMSMSNLMAPLAVGALLAAAGCTAPAADPGDLTFSGDGSFQGAHGGQPVHVAEITTIM